MTDKPASVGVWMPVFIKDRRARAATLSHLEHSALAYLEMLLWERGGTVPDDDRVIARELRLTVKQWQVMRPVLIADCTIANGTISHPATVAEVAKARVNVEQKKRAGRASAAARKVNGCSTAVATDAPAAVQPRAGGGVLGGTGDPSRASESHYQEEGYSRGVVPEQAGATLRVIAGGGK